MDRTLLRLLDSSWKGYGAAQPFVIFRRDETHRISRDDVNEPARECYPPALEAQIFTAKNVRRTSSYSLLRNM